MITLKNSMYVTKGDTRLLLILVVLISNILLYLII